MRKPVQKTNAPVRFPARGTPPDRYGYPHYQAIGEANQRFRLAYLRELKRRQAERAALLSGSAANKRRIWSRRSAEVRAGLAACLGLEIKKGKHAAVAAKFLRAHPLFSGRVDPGTPAWAADLRAYWYELPSAGWDGAKAELLVLRPTQLAGPFPGVLLIPDAGACMFGAQSPESAARTWGCALAAAGMIVAIPRLPGLEQFSSTHNKRRLLEGSCAIGAIVAEAARALDALLEQPGLAGKRAFTAGAGLGGLAALMLGALDGRVAGVLAQAPAAVGTGIDADAMQIPRINVATDLGEIAASLAPRPLALVAQTQEENAGAAAADIRALARRAAPLYGLLKSRGNLAVFSAKQQAPAIAWLLGRREALDARPSGGIAVQGPAPARALAIEHAADLGTWKSWAGKLRKAYRAQAGMLAVSKPLGIKLIGRVRLSDCMREEYHVRTGEFTCANLVFMRPHGPARRRATILHLPGSGSDVAKVEMPYAHEIVAQGWNACVIDARVALYPFHPGIPEGMAMVNQSLHDLCCCMDYVAAREDVDPKRIGTMGVSQGGTHAWMLAAMDDRIAAAAPICGVCTYQSLFDEWRTPWYDESMLSFLDSHSIYYFTPGVLRLGDQQDLCGLIAPRPLMVLGGNHDNCFPLSGMRTCDRDLRRLYALYGKPENFVYYEFEGPHSMPEHSRKAAYAFFKKAFKA